MTTEERLEKLERELSEAKRRNRWCLTVVGLAVVVLGFVWAFTASTPTAQAQAAGAAPKVVRANGFVLEDEKGKSRAMLNLLKGEAMLTLYDGNGKPRAILSGEKDLPGLNLYDEKGLERVSLRFLSEFGSSLHFSDEKGTIRVALDVPKEIKGLINSGPSLGLADAKGNFRAVLEAKDGGLTELRLTEENGGRRATLRADDVGAGLDLFDGRSNHRAALGGATTVTPDGKTTTYPESSLLFYGPDGKVLWQAPR